MGNEIKKMRPIIFYTDPTGKVKVEVLIQDENLWLTQQKIADLFDVDRTVITKHLKNIFKEEELHEKSNVQKMHIANSDKPVTYYSLDAIISVGYRVNSKKATQFRIWATARLKEYIIMAIHNLEYELVQVIGGCLIKQDSKYLLIQQKQNHVYRLRGLPGDM